MDSVVYGCLIPSAAQLHVPLADAQRPFGKFMGMQ